jgi:hypothetical protein
MNIKYDKFISLGESCFSAAALIIQQKRDSPNEINLSYLILII